MRILLKINIESTYEENLQCSEELYRPWLIKPPVSDMIKRMVETDGAGQQRNISAVKVIPCDGFASFFLEK